MIKAVMNESILMRVSPGLRIPKKSLNHFIEKACGFSFLKNLNEQYCSTSIGR